MDDGFTICSFYRSWTLCGTPDYLSPELVLSRGHDKSVDIWALGCFIFELLVGRTPFHSKVGCCIYVPTSSMPPVLVNFHFQI
jgi:protein kinase A